MFKKINNNIFVLSEQTDEELERRINDAGETQRGEPESVMLKCQNMIQSANGSNVLVNAIEHTGDLSHRAQNQNAIPNVLEKVNMMLQYWNPSRWTLEQEINEGIVSNCTYKYFNETNQYDSIKKLPNEERYKAWQNARTNPEVLKLIEKAKAETSRALELYVRAHEQHNQPITKLGMMGKQAAIQLGKLNYNELHKIFLEMKKWLDVYYASDKETRWKMFSELI